MSDVSSRRFTKKQTAVLRHLYRFDNVHEIAKAMGITTKGVYSHLRDIYEIFDLRKRPGMDKLTQLRGILHRQSLEGVLPKPPTSVDEEDP